MLFSARQAS